MAVILPMQLRAEAGIVTVVLMVLRTSTAQQTDTPKDFVYHFKGTCYFTNGTQRVRLVARQIYNREETLHFDSNVGVFEAVTELGMSSAKSWNSRKELLAEYWAHVDTLCRYNYNQTAPFTIQRRVAPMVTISLSRTEVLNHHNLLVCFVTNFYPRQVKVRWFRNKQEETAGHSRNLPRARCGMALGGLMLGLIFFASGLFVYLWEKKGLMH